MSTLIATKKRLLSTHVNKLEHLLTKLKEANLEDTPLDPTLSRDVNLAHINELEEGVSVTEVSISKVEKALSDLASLFDSPNLSGAEPGDFEEYVSRSELVLTMAFDYQLLLQARLRALRSSIAQPIVASVEPNMLPSIRQAKVKTLELPPIPIPTFGGNIWEWDSFWGIFNTNIHSQDIPDMVKFNYLLNALKGEARDSIKKFQVTGDNYNKAIQFLHGKYNNREALINALVEKLDNCALRGQTVKDQRHLLGQLQVIITQLEEKGEDVDSSWLIKKVLCKFPDALKRKVIAKKQGSASTTPFSMSLLFQYLDEVISTEELFLMFSETRPKQLTKEGTTTTKKSGPKGLIKGLCMYCRGRHPPHYCTKYATPQERSAYLRQHSLCLICASPSHNTSQCRGRMCFKCQGAHHTSSCFRANNKVTPPARSSITKDIRNAGSGPVDASRKEKVRENNGSNGRTTMKVKSHAITTPENEELAPADRESVETAVIQQHSTPNKISPTHPCLPIGEVTVADTRTRALMTVNVLLDTGAELSFIDSALAEQLQLPIIAVKDVRLMTFGSDEVRKCRCNRVRLDVWDIDGNPHTLDLFTYHILTRPLESPTLTVDDMEFLRSSGLPITGNQNRRKIKPSILLGCDQLWEFVRSDKTSISLPSGMHVLPTKIGYLVSGKPTQNGHVLQISQPLLDDIDQWDTIWSMDTVQQDTEDSEISQDEQERWDKFWTLDAAGTEQFSWTEKEARANLDQQVWEKFNNTIERRPDGYYVRLPWVEHCPYLPDNKAIAYKRLVNVWASISKDEQLLDQYNEVFQDQLQRNIIEVAEEGSEVQGNQVHYIPHQPVITPHKTTTKLRVVFDASAHYKDCPSLNDVLYRGPVLLPRIHGILLRFGIGKIAIISDIEKAFLQVRLQERDRDATRCFWLRDHKSPPSISNTITFRFTRVTFGLKSSPFLLAGTIKYHLNTHQSENDLTQDIRKNMYVDNLLQTTDDLEEAIHVYRRTKQIFQELNMNLREFSSNDQLLMDAIEEPDRSAEAYPKILGLVWDLQDDTILASCQFPDTPLMTKRTVTSAIASIYDPLGWILPLLHRAKVFLQGLWKEQYKWDQPLPEDKESEWLNIVEVVQGFRKKRPRYLANRDTGVILVALADASSSSMAACVYLCYGHQSTLLMAKSKLPSLQSKYTIPKLELNAMTLAMRLSNHVFTELKDSVNIEGIYIFSDSEIVLSWLRQNLEREVGPFVYRRVMEIRNIARYLTKQHMQVRMGYVASQENPADCATRGLTKEELENHQWWTGPNFLKETSSQWPNQDKLFEYPIEIQDGSPDQLGPDKILSVATESNSKNELLNPAQAQKLTKAKRILGYVLRFLNNLARRINLKNCRYLTPFIPVDAQHQERPGYLTAAEIRRAGLALIRHHQASHITPQIISSLQQLNIQQDEQGILRCYGRLGKAQLSATAKNPILVLQKTFLADIIIREIHQNGHPGINHTMAKVREEYWIPQLRSQVCAVIRKCVQCQRFNNLPYRYPTQEDLPQERVIRSYPFQHIGLDYFGPLSISSATGGQEKCYGAIITCMTTRLIHLDVVSDMTTRAFLNMLRRFFARRGVPQSITSDNAPTFELGESILRECLRNARNDPSVSRELSDREIEWRYNTPFAPWQGGFYERLIKSIKHSLYKTIGRSLLSMEELTTILTEIEAMLNTRPLTYVIGEPHVDPILRPIDFIQKDMLVYYPLGDGPEEQDPQYLPSSEMAAIQTRVQAMKALETSCQLIERFWKTWQTEYLTALREKHTLNIGKKRGCALHPKEGAVVLVNDPVQPRHSWKMGMIHQLIANAQGTVREAVIRLPTHRLIRRPINLLTPLELEEEDFHESFQQREQSSEGERDLECERTTQLDTTSTAEEVERGHKYNLRKRRPVDYTKDSYERRNTPGPSNMLLFTTLLQLLVFWVGSVSAEAIAIGNHESSPATRTITCTKRGVQLHLPEKHPFEICADYHCVEIRDPQEVEVITLPSEIILHEYKIQWKLSLPGSIETIETSCPPAPFCPSIECTFCSANVLNPECWPMRAIIATATIVYFLITGCYVFLYVPLTIGKPLRVLANILWTAFKFLSAKLRNLRRRHRTVFQRRRLVEILAIMAILTTTQGCQMVNVFTHHSKICSGDNNTPCRIQLSEVFKVNAFKREACVRLLDNSTLLHEIRLRWKSLDLWCEPGTDFFTRETQYKVIDSKRCAHVGSCNGEKCGAINSSSLIPELEQGNHFPGHTACIESCGGPGCDCFFFSSGCLFYRIYLEPVNDKVYEIFHCNRWRQAANIEIIHFEGASQKLSSITEYLTPNIPKAWRSLTFTLTSVSIPVLRILDGPFISDLTHTSLWKDNILPPLQCPTIEDARNLSCSMVNDCTCLPAETKINCQCRDFPIGLWFNELKNQLPVNFPFISLHQDDKAKVRAEVTSMVTSEIIMNFMGSVTSEIIVEDAFCTAEATELAGCYSCAKGAFTEITCYSSRNNIRGEVLCGEAGFTIPCNVTGITSVLRFSTTQARTFYDCSISCGTKATSFTVGGILKFTASFQGMFDQWIKGESPINAEFVWPDLFHIGSVFLQWYKTLVLTVVGLVIAVAITYLFISTFGIRLLLAVLLLGPKLVLKVLSYLTRKLCTATHNKQH